MDSSGVVTPPHVAGPFRLLPFRGLRLAPSRVGDPASARAFSRPYRTVGERLARWQSTGQLHHDELPALYLHEYTARGITIRGLVGALDVSRRASAPRERVILPHEGIHLAQADELAERMSQMGLNPAPILLVHRAPVEARDVLTQVRASAPDHEFTDRNQQRHRVWSVRDRDLQRTLHAALAESRALIADGHHRYAAYLRLQHSSPPGGSTDRGLAMLVDQDDTPLFLGAIHRVLAGVDLDSLRIAASTSNATFQETTEIPAVQALSPSTLVATDGERWATVRLPVSRDRAAVEVLHDQLIPALPKQPRRVGHHHTVEDALSCVSPSIGIAVLLPAPDVDLVLRIATDGRLLPEKATSFQPKPSSGVLIRSLRDE